MNLEISIERGLLIDKCIYKFDVNKWEKAYFVGS